MKIARILVVLYLVLSGSILAFSQATLTDDSFTSSATPQINYGSSIADIVAKGSNSYFKFSLTTFSAGITGANVSTATLIVYVDAVVASGTIDVYQVNAPWSEGTLTWGNAPALGTKILSAVPVSKTGYLSLNVTSTVQAWLNGALANNGLALVPSSGSPIAASFDSKENILTSHSSELDLVLVSAGPQGPMGIAGPAGATGPMGIAGPAGAVGPMGIAGPAGPAGVMGPAGIAGPAGAVGPMGIAGPAGPTGPAGPMGIAGPAGAVGPMGIAGPAGPQGPIGSVPANLTTLSNSLSNNGVSFFGAEHFSSAACNSLNLGDVYLSVNGYGGGGALPADGRTLPIAGHTALFSLIGTIFGGDGVNNFSLPDLRPFAPQGLQYSICATAGIYPTIL